MTKLKGKTALHEILAVESGFAETANRIQKETTKTLKEKQGLFQGLSKSHVMFSEADQHLKQATEFKEVESTVNEQLEFVGAKLIKYWNATYQKEEANQRAKADIIIDGVVISKDVPSMVLLSMEKKLESLLIMYNVIPTLDASKAWEADDTYAKPNVFRTKHAEERQHTNVSREWKEVSAATQHHKAQLAEVEKRDVVGKYIIHDYSGATTSQDKADKLERLTLLIEAVRTARQRANNTEVNTELEIGSDLIGFING